MKTDLNHLLKQSDGDRSNDYYFSERMNNVPRSFLREILKIAASPEIISFAGGVPNPDYFPLEKIKEAAIKVLSEEGRSALQYSTTEGYLPLRTFIANRYKATRGLDFHPDEILITNGSQQGLDLIGKVFLDKGDKVMLERPSYLGAIQSFSSYQPEFYNADLLEDGIDMEQAETILWENKIKLFYTVPDFQNPTGISYSEEKRKELSELFRYHETIVVEDNPYTEIRFEGKSRNSFKHYIPHQTILLGSFSKVVSPGMRIGWIACKKDIMNRIVIAKQAADLHSNFLAQKIIYSFLENNNLDDHLETIRQGYKKQRDCMIKLVRENLSPSIRYTFPEGGMFLWLTLPTGCDTFALLEKALEQGVAFVPGGTFYQDGKGLNTIRLSFSNYHEAEMSTGIRKLAKILNDSIKLK